MREIKFRAWDVQAKEMMHEVTIAPDGKVAAFSPLDGRYVRSFSHDEVIPLQYTGMNDRNGKEIYDGDIVKSYKRGIHFDPDDYAISVVKDHAYGWFPFMVVVGDKRHDYFGNLHQFEVIGNFHEHPHLLEVSQCE